MHTRSYIIIPTFMEDKRFAKFTQHYYVFQAFGKKVAFE